MNVGIYEEATNIYTNKTTFYSLQLEELFCSPGSLTQKILL